MFIIKIDMRNGTLMWVCLCICASTHTNLMPPLHRSRPHSGQPSRKSLETPRPVSHIETLSCCFMKQRHCALQSPAELKQPERQSESTANSRQISTYPSNHCLCWGNGTCGLRLLEKASPGKLIDSAADEHMGVRRRQFPGIYTPIAWQMRAS